MNQIRSISTAIFLILFFSTNIFADSDGVYCITDKYVAVQAEGIYIPAEKSSLFIVFYNSGNYEKKQVVDLSNFKSRRFLCESNRILFTDGNVIEINNINSPSIIKKESLQKLDVETKNLAMIEKSSVMQLSESKEGDLINLVLSIARFNGVVNGAGPVVHHFSMSIVKTNRYHETITSQVVAQGTRLETIH